MDLNAPQHYYLRSPSFLLNPINGDPSSSSSSSYSEMEGSNTSSVTNKGSTISNSNNNPFRDDDYLTDPLCKLNLKETSDFVRSFPNANTTNNGSASVVGFEKKRQSFSGAGTTTTAAAPALLMPSTPGRPVFSFSSSRKGNFPSKWDDAEKWLSGSYRESPTHNGGRQSTSSSKGSLRQFCDNNGDSKQAPSNGVVSVEKSRVSVDKKVHPTTTKESFLYQTFNSSFSSSSSSGSSVSTISSSMDHNSSAPSSNGGVLVLLKDKLTNNVVRYASDPTKEAFLFKDNNHNSNAEFKSAMKDASTATTATTFVVHQDAVKHRDMGTEMTPIGSSTTSRCHTPLKCISPARHNTPENRSGPLAPLAENNINIDFSQLQECHLAKLNLGKPFESVGTLGSSWSTREEEEEEVSKSLRHFEVNSGFRRSVSVSRDCAWEEEEKTKSCLRYQREEAKIQAWLNLQSAKAEAQSRKLEVKIEKMRSDLEEKLMKRMAGVHRKAEEWRAAAQLEHSEQIRKAAERALKMNSTYRRSKFICSPNTFNTHTISCGCFPCNNHLQH